MASEIVNQQSQSTTTERRRGERRTSAVSPATKVSACSVCGRGRPVDAPFAFTFCRQCALEEKFRVCAEMVGHEIKREPSILVRLRLLKQFFGVAVNEWERQKLFLVHSAESASNED